MAYRLGVIAPTVRLLEALVEYDIEEIPKEYCVEITNPFDIDVPSEPFLLKEEKPWKERRVSAYKKKKNSIKRGRK